MSTAIGLILFIVDLFRRYRLVEAHSIFHFLGQKAPSLTKEAENVELVGQEAAEQAYLEGFYDGMNSLDIGINHNRL